MCVRNVLKSQENGNMRGYLMSKGLFYKNVIITSLPLGGIGWISSILTEVHKKMFNLRLHWNYEISKFEATRERRLLPKGWNTVWEAEPERLVKHGFDKVIAIRKTLEDQIFSMALYHHPELTYDQILNQMAGFLSPIKNKWCRFEKACEFKHERFRSYHINDLNKHTKKYFNDMLDFLEFPKEDRPFLIPVKAYRNWECYSNISRSGQEQLEAHLTKIKELYLNDLKLYDQEVQFS